jgi:hypothetical protein
MKILVITSSDNSISIVPSIFHSRHKPSTEPIRCYPSTVARAISHYEYEYLQKKYMGIQDGFLLSTQVGINYTVNDVSQMLEIVDEKLFNSKSGMAYKLEKMFGEKNKNKAYGPEPGTIRIFAQNRLCYYDGKSWLRLRYTKK